MVGCSAFRRRTGSGGSIRIFGRAVSWQKSGKTILLISHRNQSRSGGESDIYLLLNNKLSFRASGE